MLVEALELATDGGIEWTEQTDEGLIYAEKIESNERRIDPAMAVCPVNDLIRALTPHIGAFIELEGGERLAVRRATPAGEGLFPDLAPGSFTGQEDRLFFGCSDGALELLTVQPAGGKPMDAASYLRGRGVPAASV